jgi:hypothetical protein
LPRKEYIALTQKRNGTPKSYLWSVSAVRQWRFVLYAPVVTE